jgi:hypothetical protein
MLLSSFFRIPPLFVNAEMLAAAWDRPRGQATGELIIFGFDTQKNPGDCDISYSPLQYHRIRRAFIVEAYCIDSAWRLKPSAVLRDPGHVLLRRCPSATSLSNLRETAVPDSRRYLCMLCVSSAQWSSWLSMAAVTIQHITLALLCAAFGGAARPKNASRASRPGRSRHAHARTSPRSQSAVVCPRVPVAEPQQPAAASSRAARQISARTAVASWTAGFTRPRAGPQGPG